MQRSNVSSEVTLPTMNTRLQELHKNNFTCMHQPTVTRRMHLQEATASAAPPPPLHCPPLIPTSHTKSRRRYNSATRAHIKMALGPTDLSQTRCRFDFRQNQSIVVERCNRRITRLLCAYVGNDAKQPYRATSDVLKMTGNYIY